MGIIIKDKEISPSTPPFIIAELSGNHNQSLERVFALIDAACESGVDAIKIQTYTPDTMTLDLSEGDFYISDSNSLWAGTSLYDLYKVAHTPWEWHEKIFQYCEAKNVICFSTPFDNTSVDFLEKFNPPCYKVASFEIVDLPLLKKIASTHKPVLLSTGMSSLAEIDEAVRTLRTNGAKDIVLLKCTSSYPATPAGSNTVTIPHMRSLFDVEVGLSDHTLGVGVAIASVALGATVIEKHFTLDRREGGVDSAFSMEPTEMRELVEQSKNAFSSLGRISYGITKQEEKSLIYRRSLYITQDIEKGTILTSDNMRSIRPGKGLSPKYYEALLGRKVAKDLPKGTPVSWDIFE